MDAIIPPSLTAHFLSLPPPSGIMNAIISVITDTDKWDAFSASGSRRITAYRYTYRMMP